MLERYCPNTVPMHMPGHKRNIRDFEYLKKLGAQYDITEIDGFDNLHEAQGILMRSMERAARLWGSRRAFYLVNGSTCGILSAIGACVPFGGEVILARNCHRSVYNAVELFRLIPRYISPEVLDGGIAGEIRAKQIDSAIDASPDAAAVVITSPTYEGVVSDISAIAEVVHRRGKILIVDEAHGAHFGFGQGFPPGAASLGADVVIHSLHKTLPSLTQTALLHVCSDRVSERKIHDMLAMLETSSPSYLLMASIDGCVRLLEEEGDKLFDRWESALDGFYSRCKALENLRLLEYSNKDKSKIVILTDRADISGVELADILRNKYRIEPEMSAAEYVLAMTGMGDGEQPLAALSQALLEIDKGVGRDEKQPAGVFPQPYKCWEPWRAYEFEGENVNIPASAGRVSLEYVWAYPPGIPLLVPGEVIDGELIAVLERMSRNGIALKSTHMGLPDKIFVQNAIIVLNNDVIYIKIKSNDTDKCNKEI